MQRDCGKEADLTCSVPNWKGFAPSSTSHDSPCSIFRSPEQMSLSESNAFSMKAFDLAQAAATQLSAVGM